MTEYFEFVLIFICFGIAIYSLDQIQRVLDQIKNNLNK